MIDRPAVDRAAEDRYEHAASVEAYLRMLERRAAFRHAARWFTPLPLASVTGGLR